MNEFPIRIARPDEYPFILSTFINGWVKNNLANVRRDRQRWSSIPQVYRSIPIDDLCDYYHNRLKPLLDYARVLTDQDDTVILGYVVGRGNTLFTLYTKPGFREYDLEADLLSSCRLDHGAPVITPFPNGGLDRLLKAHGYL